MSQGAPREKDAVWISKNLEEFSRMEDGAKKTLLGTLMYKKVSLFAPQLMVPKITGMLIDIDVLGINDILEILQNDELTKERIKEAIEIINEEDAI